MSESAPAFRPGRFAGAQGRRWWLATPSRAAALPRSSARIALGIVGVQVLAVLLTPAGAWELPDGAAAAALADAARAGTPFYEAAADLVRSGALVATANPLSGGGVPSPALPVLLGYLGVLAWPLLLLLAGTAVAAWHARLRGGGLTRAGAVAGAVLLGIGLTGLLRPAAAVLPEDWAGLFLLLAVARARPGRVAEPACWALAAALAAPAALPALGVLAFAQARSGHRRAAAAPVLAGIVALAGLALHARAVAALPAGGGATPLRFDLPAGLGALVRAGGLGLLPPLPARLLGLAAAIGWAGWGARAATLPALLLAGYVLLAAVAGDAAAAVVAPLLPLGLAALPDAARDAWRAAFDRRRITVTRVVR